MINIYTGETNLPKDKRFIQDPERCFPSVIITGTRVQREVIQLVDRGKFQDGKYFEDRFGSLMPVDFLCTSTKAIISLEAFPDYVINCTECSDNALRVISLIKDCNVFFRSDIYCLPFIQDVPVMYNGKLWETIGQLNNWLR